MALCFEFVCMFFVFTFESHRVFNQDLTEYCQRNGESFRKIGPLRVTVSVSISKDIKLPCNPECGDKADPPSRKIWFRRNLRNKEERVKLDTNSDDKQNRVFELDNHSLVIRNISERDIDVYYCREIRETFGGETLEPGIYYYIDLEDLSNVNKITPEQGDITNYLNYYINYQRINSKIIPYLKTKEARKWNIFTSWGPWGPCSSCDRPGIRKREGRCRVKRLPDWKYSRFVSKLNDKERKLNEAQKRMNFGFSCHSRRLNELPELKYIVEQISPFLLMEVCDVSCSKWENEKWRGKYFYNTVYTKNIITKKNKCNEKIYLIEKIEKLGENIHLQCPGAQLNYIIRWTNGTSLLQPRQKDPRIRIDAYGTLHINNIKFKDKGYYFCWLNGILTARINLHVISVSNVEDKNVYFIQLGAALAISFLIWLLLTIIKLYKLKKRKKFKDFLPITPVYRTFIVQKILRQDKEEI